MSTKHGRLGKVAETLREHGFRVTGARLALLEVLARSGKPLSIQTLRTRMKKPADQATLYRTLADLAGAGIVRRTDLNTGVAHFEYTPDLPHHHHLVCTGCGAIEDIEVCAVATAHDTIVKRSRNFKTVHSHTMEFFGLCLRCA